MTDDVADERERAARFGKLPERIRPEAAVETVDTKVPQGRPGAAGTEDERQVWLAGG